MDVSSDSDNNLTCTPPEIREIAQASTMNLLPEKSKKQYAQNYTTFMEWRQSNNVSSFSENVLLAYFTKLSEKYKSSTLWKIYSMLRSTLNVNNEINIENYSKLRAFLKRKGEGFQAKKSKIFSAEDINKFITESPDNIYLGTKVVLIIGIMGACRNNEMHSMKIEDIQDLNSALLITIPNTKTKIVRKFTVTGKFYEICKKYIALRPANVTTPSFFLNYQHGKCTVQKIGINKFASMGREIATYLNLPNANLYTGHSFRRSSATLLVDAGGDITALKRHGGWKSTSVAEGYVDDSMTNKMNTANKILQSVEQSTRIVHNTQHTVQTSTLNEANFYQDSTPTVLNINNCSNFTITFAKK